MRKLNFFILTITLLIIPGKVFCQEIDNDTIMNEVPDTILQQNPDIIKQAIPDKATAEVKTSHDLKGWGISLKASTLGIGLEIIRKHNQFFTFRLGGTYFPYTSKNTDTEFEIEKTYTANLSAATLIADWFVFGHLSSFHLSAGVVYNMTNMEVTGSPINTYSVGSYEIPHSQMGDVTIKLSPIKVTPYFGAGFGNFISSTSNLTFNVQLGVLYQNSPIVDFVATGMIEPTSEQVDIVARNVEGFIFYPVLDIQIVYRIK